MTYTVHGNITIKKEGRTLVQIEQPAHRPLEMTAEHLEFLLNLFTGHPTEGQNAP
jgi:hypothetical protein